MSDDNRKVYISYAWRGDSERVANELDEAFEKRGIVIVRDKRDLGYKGVISEFMKEIGRGYAVVVVICDKYLKSDNCMFELVEIAKNKDMHDRIFPIVLHDADIYQPINKADYVAYWENKKEALDTKLRTLKSENLQGLREDIDNYAAIRAHIAGLTSMLKDMNTLTPEMHENANFTGIIDRVEQRLKVAAPGATPAEPVTTVVPGLHVQGLQEGLAELLDADSSMNTLDINAIDNAGEYCTTLLTVSVEEGELTLDAADRANLADLTLPQETRSRINRSGIAGSSRSFGQIHKVAADDVHNEVRRLLTEVFGLPDDNYGVEVDLQDSTDEGEDEIEGLAENITGLLDAETVGDWQLSFNVADDDGNETSVLWLSRGGDTDNLTFTIANNNDLPSELRTHKDARRALRDEHAFETDDAGGLWLDMGSWGQADPDQVRDFVLTVLETGFDLPRDGYTMSSVLEEE
jgi:hypothetical protein